MAPRTLSKTSELKCRQLTGTDGLIGPDEAARVLEIGLVEAEGIEFIAMAERPKFLEA